MGVALRVIPCLDVKDGRVVKGVNFTGLRDAGDPVELAQAYGELGADELTFLDISASTEGRATTREMVTRCAQTVFIPLTVGGGVRSVADVDSLLRCGADKVGINTGAIARPEVIGEIADRFGNQVMVLSLDARREPGQPSGFGVTTFGGTRSAGLDAIAWCKEAVDRGAGEVLLNSMDADGTTAGTDTALTEAGRAETDAPLPAPGGAGAVEHFVAAARAGADAVLAASVFHYRTLTIAAVKDGLRAAGFEVR
ncbi:MAG: imidazole glycerol phosphate synthase subunit HisF [Acidipropionibacterium jensenii]|nr:imidazole glycerol phosphate synthase subunit HisF [Acidipropionibacterium jensenii]